MDSRNMKNLIRAGSIYVKQLMQRFPKGSPEYEEFLNIMKGFHNGEIDPGTVAVKVNALLKSHQDLLDWFQKFLPNQNNNGVVADCPKLPSSIPAPSNTKTQMDSSRKKDCIKFLNELRDGVEKEEDYRKFLMALNEFNSHKDLDRLKEEVSEIFKATPMCYINFTTQIVDICEAKHQETSRRRLSKTLPTRIVKGEET